MTEGILRVLDGWQSHRRGVYEHVYASPDQEVAGVLVGEVVDGDRLLLTGTIAAHNAVGGAAEVTFTHEAWEAIHRELDDRFPGKEIVGWYHSHPNYGIFLSKQDMFIHESFFSKWWHIAIVIDPIRHEEGIFYWRRGKVTKPEPRQVEMHSLPPEIQARASNQTHARSLPNESGLERGGNRLAAWALPALAGCLIGFLGAPAIGVGDAETPVAPVDAQRSESTPSDSAANPSVPSANKDDTSNEQPSIDECYATLIADGVRAFGCPRKEKILEEGG